MPEQHEVIAGSTQVYSGPNGDEAKQAYTRNRLRMQESVIWRINGRDHMIYTGPTLRWNVEGGSKWP